MRAHSENASKEDRQLTKRTEEAMLNVKLAATRSELLLQMVPAAKSVAYLRNPTGGRSPHSELVQAAARTLGVQLSVVDATSFIGRHFLSQIRAVKDVAAPFSNHP